MPARWRVTQKINGPAAGLITTAITTPVARMTGRHPHIDGLHLRHDRPAPHGLSVKQLRRWRITNIDLTINPRRQLPGDGATDIGLSLGSARRTNQCKGRQATGE